MKTFFMLLGMPLASLAGPPPAPPPPHPSNLWLAVQESRAATGTSTAAGPRQLTPAELAELRRQIRQFSGRPGKP